MKNKRLLRFYFNADGLNEALDRLIFACAFKSAYGQEGGVFYAERIISVITAKNALAGLWQYLDGVMGTLREKDRETLRFYSSMRTGIKCLREEERKNVKRAMIKFIRHARHAERFEEGIRLVNEYYCLL